MVTSPIAVAALLVLCKTRTIWLLVPAVVMLNALTVATAPAQTVAGDVSASVPETGAQAFVGALAAATVEPSSGVLRSALTFTLPSARGSTQPSLSLAYSSSAGIREAGVGWGMPMPAIERSTKRGAPRLDDDLVKLNPKITGYHPVTYEKPNPDELLYNGERLIPICEVGSEKTPCDTNTVTGMRRPPRGREVDLRYSLA